MKTTSAVYRLFLILCLALSGAALFGGCSKDSPNEDKPGVQTEALTGADVAVVVMDGKKSVVLMGHLLFEDITAETVTGKWRFETWGENGAFSMLPANWGPDFTGTDYIGDFTGTVFGDMLILDIPLPESASSLGIVLDHQEGENIYGSAALLPDKTFSGSLKALKYTTQTNAARLLE